RFWLLTGPLSVGHSLLGSHWPTVGGPLTTGLARRPTVGGPLSSPPAASRGWRPAPPAVIPLSVPQRPTVGGPLASGFSLAHRRWATLVTARDEQTEAGQGEQGEARERGSALKRCDRSPPRQPRPVPHRCRTATPKDLRSRGPSPEATRSASPRLAPPNPAPAPPSPPPATPTAAGDGTPPSTPARPRARRASPRAAPRS